MWIIHVEGDYTKTSYFETEVAANNYAGCLVVDYWNSIDHEYRRGIAALFSIGQAQSALKIFNLHSGEISIWIEKQLLHRDWQFPVFPTDSTD